MKKKFNSKKSVFAAVALIVVCSAVFVVPVRSQESMQTIHICSDGTVTPDNVPIVHSGNKYTLTGDIFGMIIIDKPDVLLDGAGYTVRGSFNGTKDDPWMIGQGPNSGPQNTTLWTIGVDLNAATRPNNVTVQNLNVHGFYIGVYLWTYNNALKNSAIYSNIVGLLITGDNDTIQNNYIANNTEGVFLGVTAGAVPQNIILTGNSFIENQVQFSGCTCEDWNVTEDNHTWDNGKVGNYWSDYTGDDLDDDGLGDTPYVIDPKNEDRYPLMKNALTLPLPETSSGITSEVVLIIVVAVAVPLVAVVVALKRRESRS
jgi:nitrous oxidase accessory protein NosD